MKTKGLKLIIFSVAILCLASFTVLSKSNKTDGPEKTINHSHASVSGKECPRCEGTGRISYDCQFCNYGNRECQLCYGKCEIRCTYCQGGGSFRCNRCAGRGYNGEDECPNCNGTGEIECSNCSGTKIIPCPSCGAKGMVPCMSCGGKGYTEWNCPQCGGSGVVDDDD